MIPQKQKQHVDTRTCEICGREFITGYGYSIAGCWLVTGHCAIQSFMCEQTIGNQHWGCTPEHAMDALIECLQHDEHLSVTLLKNKHDNHEHDRVADGDKWMLDRFPNFPFVEGDNGN